MFGMFVGAGLIVLGTVAMVHHRHGMHKAMFGCAMKRLKANDAQKQRMGELFESTRSRMLATRERARVLRRELADVLVAPEADTKRLETLEAHLFEVVAEGSQVLRDAVTQTHQILDPGQRQQLAEWLREGHHCRGHFAHCHH
jgi:Spy/CpxP family protein refolding chaperone